MQQRSVVELDKRNVVSNAEKQAIAQETAKKQLVSKKAELAKANRQAFDDVMADDSYTKRANA